MSDATVIAASIAAVASIAGAGVTYINQSRTFREERRRLDEQQDAEQKQIQEQADEQRRQFEMQADEQRRQFERQAVEQRDQLGLQLGMMREGQLTERFTRAVDQLGHAAPDVRVGGIYALEQIADASQRDRQAIVEVLATYVQTHAPWPPSLIGQPGEHVDRGDVKPLRAWAPDVQAAMTVLGRRRQDAGDPPLDLSEVALRRAELSGANLQQVQMYRSCLQRAILQGANLGGINLARTRLDATHLRDASLKDAVLSAVGRKSRLGLKES